MSTTAFLDAKFLRQKAAEMLHIFSLSLLLRLKFSHVI